MERLQNRGLTSYDLKWIGMILMILDHIHYFFGFTGQIPEWFSMAGRLSAPLFLFCLAEGFHYTHDRKKYFQRVYLIHLLMSGLLFLTLCGIIPVRPDGFYPMNGMMGTFVILMPIFQGIDWLREKRWGRGSAAVILPLAWPFLARILMQGVPVLQFPLAAVGYTVLPMWNSTPDSGLPIIVTGILLYLFRGNRKVQAGAFAGFTMFYYMGLMGSMVSRLPDFRWAQMFTVYYEWYGVFAVALMLCYNGKRGNGPKTLFYAFYPAHVYLLYVLSWLACAA